MNPIKVSQDIKIHILASLDQYSSSTLDEPKIAGVILGSKIAKINGLSNLLPSHSLFKGT